MLQKTVADLENYSRLEPTEKIYLHFDKPYYSLRDTIWFKAYSVIGSLHQPSGLSNVLYADLINSRDSIIKTIKLPLTAGVAWGEFVLNGSVKDGGYRVRAYTRWMRNTGDTYFFNKALSPNLIPLSKAEASTAKEVPIQLKNSIQFFPESGDLVNGLRSKIAFKAIDPQGFGIEVTGTIRDEQNMIVAELNSQHLGMGVFALLSQKGKHYKATLNYADGSTATVDLPEVNDNGFTMSINANLPDSILVKVAVSESLFQTKKNTDFYLIAQTGGTVYFTSQAKLESPVFTARISKLRFPSGIVQFTLFSADGEPLSERVAFIQASDLLSLDVKTDRSTYSPRQKVNMDLSAKNSDNEPVIGSFSVSVINESKVPVDETSQSTILSNLLLTSELKGYVEKPNYYFMNPKDKTWSDLDVLMLTQGYRRFDWKKLNTKAPTLTFQPEKALEISGMISTSGGKPIPGGSVRLFNPAENIVIDTISDINGKFTFTNLEMSDNSNLVIQGRKANDGKNVEISILQNPPPSTKNVNINNLTRYRNPFAQLNIPSEPLTEMEKKDSILRIIELNKVTVIAKKMVKPDEHNSYGTKEERVLDLQKLKDYTTVYDALMAKIVGINPTRYPYANMDDLSGPGNMEKQNVILDGWETGLSSLQAIYIDEVQSLSLIGAGFRKEGYTIRVDTKSYAGTDTTVQLSEVSVKSTPIKKKHIVTNSANLNGPGHADQVLFADQLTGCITLSECLASKLNFTIKKDGLFYTMRSLKSGGPPMVVIYNGMLLDGSYLDQINASDVASIEVLIGMGNLSIYGSNAPGGALIITTKQGGEESYATDNQRAPGILTYNFNGYYKAKQFYTPVYDNSISEAQQTDTRSTIFWKPDVITDQSGHASFQFYNSDNKGIYKVIVEGINDDGNIGRSVYRYKVE